MEILLFPVSGGSVVFPSSQLRVLEASGNTLNKCLFFIFIQNCHFLLVAGGK